MTRLAWLSALLLTALGLYCSRGLLDIVAAPAGVVRIAMLPPWWELAVFAAVLGGVAVTAARADSDVDVVLPLAASVLLVLPYLPWLADRLPILRALAGPMRELLWVVLAYLVFGRLFEGVPWRARFARVSPAAVIFLVSVAVFGGVAWRLTHTINYPSGDEPHYLVITQSLLTDHDLKIENNHQRGDYKQYFSLPLKPDYLTRGVDGQIYSIHPVGLPVLAMPAFAIGGYPAVVVMQIVLAALAAVLMWTLARQVSGSTSAATFAWAASALTAPFLFNAFTVYPETPGALAVLIALAWRPDADTTGLQIVRGVAIASLPWLSTKYAPMAAVTTAVLMLRARLNVRTLIPMLAPIAASFAGWFLFFHWIWGTFAPSAPYGNSEPTTFAFLAHGGPGLFFDQEYGIVAYAPVLVLAFAGFARMLRSRDARLALELLAVLAALVATVGAFRLWWGGSAAPGRPIASGVLLLGVPIAWLFAKAPERSGVRAVYRPLLASSLAIAGALALTQNGTLLFNDRDGAATLFEWLSPTWPLTSVLPSFIAQSLAEAAARTVGWIALVAVVARAAQALAPRQMGAAALATVLLGTSGAVVLASITKPLNAPTVDPQARSSVPLLDRFDARRRPLILLYDPLSRIAPDEALTRTTLIARPGQRTTKQPVDLLWNARFALPAGEYRVDVERPPDAANADGPVGLQVGRVGQPLERWTIGGSRWEHRMVLPIDAQLVGLRPLGSAGLGAGELRITPMHTVDESRRTERPPVLSAAHYGALTTYFHDDFSSAEPAGYWTRGRATTHVTYASPAATSAINLDVRCGPIGNRITFSTRTWTERILVEPGGSQHLTVPTIAEPELNLRIVPLDITAQDGFVPAEVDRTSSDRRLLGCYIEHPGS